MMIANDRFLYLLNERKNRRDAVLLSINTSPPVSQQSVSNRDGDIQLESQTRDVDVAKRKIKSSSSDSSAANLSTHYLFSSSRPQNEIQNPYPYCFEGYPKLQRYIHYRDTFIEPCLD